MFLDQRLERDGHGLLNSAGVVDIARDVEELGARVALAAEAGKPRPSPPTDGLENEEGWKSWIHSTVHCTKSLCHICFEENTSNS